MAERQLMICGLLVSDGATSPTLAELKRGLNIMETKGSVITVLISLCIGFVACANPRKAIERKYAFAVEEARIRKIDADYSGHRGSIVLTNLELAEAELALTCTKRRTLDAELKKLGRVPNSMPKLCDGKGE